MTDRLEHIKDKWNIPATLPMAVPHGKDDVAWLVGEVERLRAEASLDPPEPEREPEAQRPTCVGACDGAVSVAGSCDSVPKCCHERRRAGVKK